MNRIIVFVLVASLAILVGGCGKKTQEAQLPLESSEVLNEAELLPAEQAMPAASVSAGQNLNTVKNAVPAASTAQGSLSSGKAMPKEIQQALKNAGIYKGSVDGVIGPKTKQAIKDFQAQNNLSADGKVGPKTWSVLKTFLTQPQQPSVN